MEATQRMIQLREIEEKQEEEKRRERKKIAYGKREEFNN